MTWMVDANVVVKWFVAEGDRDHARNLVKWRGYLCAPDFIVTEVAWKKYIRGEIERDHATFISTVAREYVDTLYSPVELTGRALKIALSLNHPIYDCLYLACAEHLDGIVVTADQRLSKCVVGTDFEDRVAVLADLDFARFIPPLQTPTETIKNIVRLSKLIDEAHDHLRDTLTDGKEFQPVDVGELDPIFRSPNWINLFSVLDAPSKNQLVDVLALGWLGQGYSGIEWQPLRNKTGLALNSHDADYLRYVCSLSCYPERGFTVL